MTIKSTIFRPIFITVRRDWVKMFVRSMFRAVPDWYNREISKNENKSSLCYQMHVYVSLNQMSILKRLRFLDGFSACELQVNPASQSLLTASIKRMSFSKTSSTISHWQIKTQAGPMRWLRGIYGNNWYRIGDTTRQRAWWKSVMVR